MAKYFISTPIYYINDKAHIGTAYTTIAADVMARYRRAQGDEVLFTTGTDENSQKTVKSAEEAGQDVGEYVDKMAKEWKQTFDELDISYSQFVRTTEERHQKSVYALLESMRDKEDIYQGVYEGLYCSGCEDFVKQSELIDGKCAEHDRQPQSLKENNYFFKLSQYQDKLLSYIEEHPEFIQPDSRRHEVKAFIERGLDDISITREGQEWGIPYPFDPDHTIYVWAEALINYLTVTGYPEEGHKEWWPADVHLVGKGIIKFHCIIWPAMLMSAGLEMPKQVFAHGHLNLAGKKMSKSLGNIIGPRELIDSYGVDATRYLLLRDTPFGQDGDVTRDRFHDVYVSELADDLGNLASRVSAMLKKYCNGMIGPASDPAHDTSRYHRAMDEWRLDTALHVVSEFVKDLNLYIEEQKPWEVAKTDNEHVRDILSYLASNLVEVAGLLAPFMPQTAEKIEDAFGGDQLQEIEGTLFPKEHASD